MYYLTRVIEYVDQTVSGGYVIAISLVCLLQYVVYIYRISHSRRQTDRYRREMEGIESELSGVQKDRTLARLENQILREFVSESEINKALDLLLRRFVPNPKDGYGALVRIDGSATRLVRSRGLRDQSKKNIAIEAELLDRVSRERAIVLEGSQLFSSQLLATLSRADRDKTRQLFLIAVGDSETLSSVLVTTSLYPAGGPRPQQIELAQRLMLSFAGNLKRSQTFEQQRHELRSTGEILELRSIIDRDFDTPMEMIEAYLTCLMGKIGADRAALYLSSQQAEGATRALIRCGCDLQPTFKQRWFDQENVLAESGLERLDLSTYDESHLKKLGITTLFSSALVAPMVQRQAPIGVACFSKRSREGFSQAAVQLADWAVGHLAETILRALSRASVERQARQDALTELANRRTFDELIAREIQTAAGTGAECSLMLFDIDHFKSINDEYGHQAGDEVLRVVARILREQVSQIRSNDRALAARYGGEELAVLLPGIGVAGTTRIAESIRAAVEGATVHFEGTPINVTLSVGIAAYPLHAQTVSSLISAADAALYQAKQSGRNRVACVEKSLV